MSRSVQVIVLAGGSSRRFGSDKLAAPLSDGLSVLDACLTGMPSAWPLVVVGPSRPVPAAVSERVRWVRESPPGGGPLAGVAAGLALVEAEVVCLVAGDTPGAGGVLPALVSALLADPALDAAVASDGEGRANPLLAAYRVEALRGAVPSPAAGVAARTLLTLPHVVVPAPAEARDVDTPADLAAMTRKS
ncbi:molybdopterin-guanine dinucleotide biosynthesis protein MobA [Knoellia flava TL1]|nr:NTP transferase domain-containing protein [Knoellia flava]KGN35956.1 molybdopterin-guanine dinucleotide biosynthesis protein MobA [Knoellia flava TL1]